MPDYVIEAKGGDWIADFVDPGPPFDPAVGPDDAFFRGIVEESAELVLAFGHDGTVSYANDALRVLLGWDPAVLVGRSVLDLVAPEDVANAADTIHHAAEVVGWRPPRPVRLRHADGRHITFDVAGLSLFHVPTVRSVVVVARWADDHARVDRALGLLAAHRPVAEILAELVHLLHRPGWQLATAIQYDDLQGGFATVSSHPDSRLAGDGAFDVGPWAAARDTGSPVIDIGLITVPSEAAAAAMAGGLSTCWALPVPDQAGRPACLVVWNAEPIAPELGQDLVLQRVLSLVELALDGRAYATSLERAAGSDPLTGLANRRRLEASAAACGGPATVLVCDLDGFKAVNDELGHLAGDAVLCAVAHRLVDCVRTSDVVARLGGDEFAIVCPGLLDDDVVEALADRIVQTVSRPIDHDGGTISVGVSVGAARASTDTGWHLRDLLDRADVQLLAAKAAGKAGYRIEGAPTPDRRRRPPHETASRATRPNDGVAE